MHADEVGTDAALVRRLVEAQFPEWAGLAVEPVPFRGTDNALYRLGDDKVVRLPTRPRTAVTLEKERRLLPKLAPHLPLAVPTPLAEGEPGEGYPFTWSVYRWLPGKTVIEAPVADPRQAALDLAGFIAALQRIDPTGGPGPAGHNFGRGEPLANRDEPVRAAIAALGAHDRAAAWEEALNVPGQATLQIYWDYAQNTPPSKLIILHIWQECGLLLTPRQTGQGADSQSPTFERAGTWRYYCGRRGSKREFSQLHGTETIVVV